jgi:hypothetical protein
MTTKLIEIHLKIKQVLACTVFTRTVCAVSCVLLHTHVASSCVYAHPCGTHCVTCLTNAHKGQLQRPGPVHSVTARRAALQCAGCGSQLVSTNATLLYTSYRKCIRRFANSDANNIRVDCWRNEKVIERHEVQQRHMNQLTSATALRP